MLNVLITVGRWTVVVGAFLTVTASTVEGWIIGTTRDTLTYGYQPIMAGSTAQVGFAILGLLFGILVSGLFCGLSAAVYDMQLSLRELSGRAATGAHAPGPLPAPRAEPRW